MAPSGYSPNYKYYADAADLNAYSAKSILGMGFSGVYPYVGIGGGGSLPNKRLTAERYLDYIQTGIEIPGAFVEFGTNDADSGYQGGVNNAQAAVNDLAAIGADIPLLIAVNDKTTWNNEDLEYVRGFSDVVGNHRCGVYGFSGYLQALRPFGYVSYYHQCGNSPIFTGTNSFVNVWQRNDGYVNGLDVNQQLMSWTHKEDDELINFFVDNASLNYTDKSYGRIVMEIGSLVYNTNWAQYQAKQKENIASLTGLETDDFNALVSCSDGQKSVPGLLEMMIQKLGMPVDTGAVQKAIGGALKNAGESLGG